LVPARLVGNGSAAVSRRTWKADLEVQARRLRRAEADDTDAVPA
jgi:hypothetical protein